MSDLFLYQDLDAALTRCMAAHPPVGQERRLHPDAQVMTGLWAEMTVAQRMSTSVNEVEPAVRDAVQRWTHTQPTHER